ncbi:MAG: hypothetical protein ACLGIY_17370, partial [Betaproteobacteria bacterium]
MAGKPFCKYADSNNIENMAIINVSAPKEHPVEIKLPAMTEEVKEACEDYMHYIKFILEPAKLEIATTVRKNRVSLHQAFGANLILAHSVDYLKAIRSAAGIKESRANLIKSFDELFAVDGAHISNRKMELIDAVNNALKHIRIKPDRYVDLGDRYGQISFKSLVEHDGRVLCHLEQYRFDYCRAVLLPGLKALSNWNFEDAEGVLKFAMGNIPSSTSDYSSPYDSGDPSEAIDRMVEICSSPCRNCEEQADDCRCSQYIFDGEGGRFEPLHSVSESDFNELMSQIS